MTHTRLAAAPITLLMAAALLGGAPDAKAQASSDKPTSSTANRPAKEPQSQVSLPGSAPPASRTHTTGATDHSPTVKKMNEKAKATIKETGK